MNGFLLAVSASRYLLPYPDLKIGRLGRKTGTGLGGIDYVKTRELLRDLCSLSADLVDGFWLVLVFYTLILWAGFL